MKINWDFLKDSAGLLNFGRVIPACLFILNIFALAATALFSDILAGNMNCWQAIVHCSGFITGIMVYLIEIVWRERIKLKVKIGDKEIQIGGGDESK